MFSRRLLNNSIKYNSSQFVSAKTNTTPGGNLESSREHVSFFLRWESYQGSMRTPCNH